MNIRNCNNVSNECPYNWELMTQNQDNTEKYPLTQQLENELNRLAEWWKTDWLTGI